VPADQDGKLSRKAGRILLDFPLGRVDNAAGWFDEFVSAAGSFPVGSGRSFCRPSWRAFTPGRFGSCAHFDLVRKEELGAGPLSNFRSPVMGKKLYCGNLSFNTSSNDLDTLFSEYGTVKSAEVINDRDTGRSKGFGFVEMSNDSEAMAAISGINGKEHDGRTLTVNEARPKEERRGGGGGGGGRGGYGGGGGGGRRY
jgi:cold-inducible RNA-binding protein